MQKAVQSGLSIKHELVVEWFLLNPDCGLGECAKALGYRRGWLAQIIASDSFQAHYAQRAREAGREALFVLRARTQALQLLAVERGIELMESGAASERFTLEVLKTAIAPQGGSTSTGPNGEQHFHLHVSAADIQEARRIASLAREAAPSPPRKLQSQEAPPPPTLDVQAEVV